jgi:hypothetical protein
MHNRRHRKDRRNKPALNPSKSQVGCWEVEYECGLTMVFPPTNPKDIESKVKESPHACERSKCRPWRYTRIEEEMEDGRLGANS